MSLKNGINHFHCWVQLKKQQGISLIIVLWMLAILTVIALVFSQGVRTEVMLTANYQKQAKALALAEAGIWRGVAMALNKGIAQKEGHDIRFDGYVYSLASDAGLLKVSLQSADGLVDLNRAPKEVIEGVLASVASEDVNINIITDSLLDWRDEDNLRRLAGAERDDYYGQGLSYGPTNGLMVSTNELARVNGVKQELYQKTLPLVTVYSGRSRIDITSAPEAVLRILPGMTDSVMTSIMDDRDAGRWNINLAVIPTEMRQYIGAGQDEFLRISSYAEINGSISGIIAVVKLEASASLPVTVMSWRNRVDNKFIK